MKSSLFYLSFLFLFLADTAHTQTLFYKEYGAENPQMFREAQPTPDGGYMLGGTRKTSSGGQWQMLLSRTDMDGNLIWSKTYVGPDDQSIFSLKKTLDGNYVMAGRTKSYVAGEHDVFITKVNEDGNIIWSKVYGGPGQDWINTRVIATSDGGYLVSAYTDSYGAGSIDCYMVKTDELGDTLWTRTMGGTGYDYCTEVIEMELGGYAMAGFTSSIGQGGYDALLSRLDAQGDTLWTKVLGHSNGLEENLYGLVETPDHGFILTGKCEVISGNDQALVVRTNSQGNILWSNELGGGSNDVFSSIHRSGDGNYLLLGYGRSYGNESQIYLMKMDINGNSIWARSIGTPDFETVSQMNILDDGGMIIAGRKNEWPDDLGVVIRLDSLGYSAGCHVYDLQMNSNSIPLEATSGLILGHGAIVNSAPYTASDYSLPTHTWCTTECFISSETSGSDLLCNGDSSGTALIEVVDHYGFYDLLWSTGDTLETIDSLHAGWHYVTITDSLDCMIQDSIWLAEPDLLTLDASITHVTNLGNGSIDLIIEGGTDPYDILWDTEETGSPLLDLQADTFAVDVTDEHGCAVSGTFIVLDSTSTEIGEWEQRLVNVFPNPSHGAMSVQFDRHYTELDIRIFSEDGKLIRSIHKNNADLIHIADYGISPGTYLMDIDLDGVLKKQLRLVVY